MKQFIFAFSLSMLTCFHVFSNTETQIDSNSDAIIAFNNQLILSQTAVKNYLLIGINCEGSLISEARLSIQNSIDLFDQYKKDLDQYISGNSTLFDFNNLYMYWESCKDILYTEPDLYSASLLLDLNSSLLDEFQSLIEKLEGICTDNPNFETCQALYAQRLLSERMVCLYIGYTWGVESEKNIKKEYIKCREAFKKGMQKISDNDLFSDEVKADLEIICEKFESDSKDIKFYKNNVLTVYTDSKLINKKTEDISMIFVSQYSVDLH